MFSVIQTHMFINTLEPMRQYCRKISLNKVIKVMSHFLFIKINPAPVISDSDRLEHQLEEAVSLRQDYESSASKLRSVEKQVKSLRQEKDEVHKVRASGCRWSCFSE